MWSSSFFCWPFQGGLVGAEAAPGRLTVGSYDVGRLMSTLMDSQGNSKTLVWRGWDWAWFLSTTGLKQTNSTWESSWLYTCVWFRREICIVNINTIPITYKFFGHLVVWFHTAEYLLGVKWNMEFIITVNCRWGVHTIWLSGCQRHSGNEKEPPSEQMSCYGVFRTLSSGICDCHLRWQGTWFT